MCCNNNNKIERSSIQAVESCVRAYNHHSQQQKSLTSNAVVTTGDQHRDAAQAELHELLVAALTVLDGPGVRGVEDVGLHVAVGDGVHKRRVGLVADVVQIGEESFVDGIVRVQIAEGVEVGLSVGSQGLQYMKQLTRRRQKRTLYQQSSTPNTGGRAA